MWVSYLKCGWHPLNVGEFTSMFPDTYSKILFLPKEALSPELDLKWTCPGLKQKPNFAGVRLQCLWPWEFLPAFDPS